MLSLLLLAGLSLYLLAAPVAAQSGVPSWYIDMESAYPRRSFIAAVGEGKTRADAENAATIQVSMFFDTSMNRRSEAIREFNDAVRNDTTDFSQKTYITENAVITSDADFLGIRFATPWQDQSRGVWAALAYIDRREAAQMYDSRIRANMAAINALASDAEKETEALYAAGLLNRAARLCDITGEYIKTAAMVDSAAGEKYGVDIAKIEAVRSEYRARRDSLSFAIAVESPENSGRLERKLAALMEDSGFAISRGRALYTLNARLSGEETTSNAGSFVTPGITIRIEREGKTLFSYSKSYDRSSHRASMSSAWTRAVLGIEADLEANFIRQFTAVFGR